MPTTNANLDPNATMQRVNERISRILRAAAMDATRQLLLQHPVDTGYSRSQWRVAQDEIDRSTDTAPTSAERYASRDRKGWYPQKVPSVPSSVDARSSIFITNSVGYVRYLEEGSSKQAPAHFIKGIAQSIASRMNKYIRASRT